MVSAPRIGEKLLIDGVGSFTIKDLVWRFPNVKVEGFDPKLILTVTKAPPPPPIEDPNTPRPRVYD